MSSKQRHRYNESLMKLQFLELLYLFKGVFYLIIYQVETYNCQVQYRKKISMFKIIKILNQLERLTGNENQKLSHSANQQTCLPRDCSPAFALLVPAVLCCCYLHCFLQSNLHPHSPNGFLYQLLVGPFQVFLALVMLTRVIWHGLLPFYLLLFLLLFLLLLLLLGSPVRKSVKPEELL